MAAPLLPLIALALLAEAPAAGDLGDGLPEGGVLSTPAATAAEPEVAGLGDGGQAPGTVRVVPARGAAAAYDERAVRAAMTGAAGEPWAVGYNEDTTAPIAAGDLVSITALLRVDPDSVMTGRGTVTICLEDNGEPFDKSIYREVNFGGEWERVTVSFEATKDWAPGEAQVAVHLAHGRQTVELADVRLVNFGRSVELADLPDAATEYEGMAADAPWRAEAAARIDRLRRADLTVNVLDEGGQPVAGAQVRVELVRHAFAFGTAVASRVVAEDSPAAARYRQVAEGLFNEVVIENGLKWPVVIGRDFGEVEATLAWAEQNRMTVRGHTLVWPGLRWLPDFVAERVEAGKATEVENLVAEHVIALPTRVKGRIAEWDVVNEPRANRDVQRLLSDEENGADVIAGWFELAHEADPDALLYLNDYGILTAGANATGAADFYLELIADLQDRDAPIHGVGLQGHFGLNPVPPERIWATLDRFAGTGLKVKVTELDIDTDDQELQARYMTDLMTALLAHEAVDGVLVWGFWEGRHWRPRSAFYDLGWNLRPIGEAYRDLVQGEWRTRATADTDGQGSATVRGFKGQYAVQVTYPDGRVVQTEVMLPDGGTSLDVRP